MLEQLVGLCVGSLPPPAAVVPADRVLLPGELDLATAPEVEIQLAKVDGDILIDCARLIFIDVGGLRPLLSAHRRCIAQGKRLALVNPPQCLMRLLELTDLTAIFEMQADD